MFFSPTALIMSSSNGGSFSQAGSGAYPGFASRVTNARPFQMSFTHFVSEALAAARADTQASLSRSPSLGRRSGQIARGAVAIDANSERIRGRFFEGALHVTGEDKVLFVDRVLGLVPVDFDLPSVRRIGMQPEIIFGLSERDAVAYLVGDAVAQSGV